MRENNNLPMFGLQVSFAVNVIKKLIKERKQQPDTVPTKKDQKLK
jgi:hypothetical protein